MKRKVGLILLIVIPMILVGCARDKLGRANKYMINGNVKKAEELYKKIILENGNHEAYGGLINIYNDTGKIEKLTEIVKSAIEQGYTPEENLIYLNILEYYDSIDDRNKVIELIGGTFNGVNLPISVYKEYLLKDKIPKNMELIEMKCGDINNDNINEIVVLLGSPQKEINMNYYESMRIQVYNLRGEIIYEDYTDGGYLLYPEIALVDLNKDGVKDLYYNVIYDTITNAHTMAKIVSFKDDRIDLIYSDGLGKLDINIEIIDEHSYKIYSHEMDQFHIVKLDITKGEQLVPNIKPYIVWREVYEKIGIDPQGEEILQVDFEIEGYTKVQVDYDYIDGEIKPVNFRVGFQ